MRRQYFDYRPRPQFRAFHLRKERFACIITHRRAGKTVACIHELQRRAVESTKKHPRFAYLSPLLKQSKTVAWDYLRDAMSLLRKAVAAVCSIVYAKINVIAFSTITSRFDNSASARISAMLSARNCSSWSCVSPKS
jgi:hypothetical protein